MSNNAQFESPALNTPRPGGSQLTMHRAGRTVAAALLERAWVRSTQVWMGFRGEIRAGCLRTPLEPLLPHENGRSGLVVPQEHAAVRKQFCVVESYDRSSTRHGVCDESPACEYRRRVRQPLPRLAAAREPQQRRRKQRMPRHRSGCFGATWYLWGTSQQIKKQVYISGPKKKTPTIFHPHTQAREAVGSEQPPAGARRSVRRRHGAGRR